MPNSPPTASRPHKSIISTARGCNDPVERKRHFSFCGACSLSSKRCYPPTTREGSSCSKFSRSLGRTEERTIPGRSERPQGCVANPIAVTERERTARGAPLTRQAPSTAPQVVRGRRLSATALPRARRSGVQLKTATWVPTRCAGPQGDCDPVLASSGKSPHQAESRIAIGAAR